MTGEMPFTGIDEFLASPLVMFFGRCLGGNVKDQLSYEELIDGVLIYDVLLQMDIDGQSNDVSPANNNPDKQLANLETVMRRIRQFYEDHLGEVVLRQPDLHLIVQEPRSNVREVELLLVLLLGCAVKCRNNKRFVEVIKTFDHDTKWAIAKYVKKIMCFPDLVLSKEMLLDNSVGDEQTVHKAFLEIQRVTRERNELREQLRSASLKQNQVPSREKELKEWKSEAIALNDQLDECKRKLVAIESENKRLAAQAKSHREALDLASDKVHHVERLEQQIAQYQKKLKDMSSYKIRVGELELSNRSLKENNKELVGQLSAQKAHSRKKMKELEVEVDRLQVKCDELMMENETNCEENSRLYEENADLERRIKLSSSMNVTLDDSFGVEADDDEIVNASLCEQLSQSAHSHALKLELGSRRLEMLKENSGLEFHDSEDKKKRLELANEALKAKIDRLEEMVRGGGEKVIEESKGKLEDDDASKSPPRHEVEYDQLYSDYRCVLQERNSLERQLSEVKIKLMERDEDDVDEEYSNLKQDYTFLMSEYRREKIKVEDLAKRLEEAEMKVRMSNVKIFDLQGRYGKLQDKYELQTELRDKLQLENERLMQQIPRMLEQNHSFVAKTLERHQRFYDEDRKKNETLNNLSRAKAKLEDKVMDHYRSMSSRRESKKRSAVSAVKNTFAKVRRAGSEFFGASRWSSAEDADFARGSKTLAGAARTAGIRLAKTPRNRKSVDFLDNFQPENFSFDGKKGRD